MSEGQREVVIHGDGEKVSTRKSLSTRTGWQLTSQKNREGLAEARTPTIYYLPLWGHAHR